MKKRILSFVLALSLFFPILLNSIFADEIYRIDTLVDKDDWTFSVNAIYEDLGYSSKNDLVAEQKVADFYKPYIEDGKIKGFDTSIVTSTLLEQGMGGKFNKIGVGKPGNGKPFTFPSFSESGTREISPTEKNRASYIANELSSTLNSIIRMINDEEIPENRIKDELSFNSAMKKIKNLENGKHLGKYRFYFSIGDADTISISGKKIKAFDKNGNKLMYIVPVTNKSGGHSEKDLERLDKLAFIWAIPKGYRPTHNHKALFTNKEGKEFSWAKTQDVEYLSIFHIMDYGLIRMNRHIDTLGTAESNESGGLISDMISSFLDFLLRGLTTVLGLNTTNELIYNYAERGSNAYIQGSMPKNWWSIVLFYNTILQMIALMVIAVAFVKKLLEINLSTINPSQRLSAWESIQKFFVVGVLLMLSIPIVSFMLEINSGLVDIFAKGVDLSRATPKKVPGIAGIVVQYVYFGITLYVNMLYIIRSIMIAILSASAPIFIVSMAFSKRGYGLFDNWIKELSANIFMQSFHALSFAFIFNVMGTGGGIRNIVLAFSIIPITEFFRSLIFGTSGSFAERQGKTMQHASHALTKKGLSALTNGITGTLRQGISGESEMASTTTGASGAAGQGGGVNPNIGKNHIGKAFHAKADQARSEGKTWQSAIHTGMSGLSKGVSTFASVGSGIDSISQETNLGESGGIRQGTSQIVDSMSSGFSQGMGMMRELNENRRAKTNNTNKSITSQSRDGKSTTALTNSLAGGMSNIKATNDGGLKMDLNKGNAESRELIDDYSKNAENYNKAGISMHANADGTHSMNISKKALGSMGVEKVENNMRGSGVIMQSSGKGVPTTPLSMVGNIVPPTPAVSTLNSTPSKDTQNIQSMPKPTPAAGATSASSSNESVNVSIGSDDSDFYEALYNNANNDEDDDELWNEGRVPQTEDYVRDMTRKQQTEEEWMQEFYDEQPYRTEDGRYYVPLADMYFTEEEIALAPDAMLSYYGISRPSPSKQIDNFISEEDFYF